MKSILIILFLVSLSPILFAQEGNAKKLEGRKAPDFKLETMDGDYVQLSDYLGKGPVLIAFWATWCKPCAEELTEFKKTYKEFEPKGLKIVAISIDNEKTASKVKPFVKSRDYPFDILLDPNSDVARKYYAYNIPYSVLLDKNGTIVYSHLGYMKGNELTINKKIEEIFKEN